MITAKMEAEVVFHCSRSGRKGLTECQDKPGKGDGKPKRKPLLRVDMPDIQNARRLGLKVCSANTPALLVGFPHTVIYLIMKPVRLDMCIFVKLRLRLVLWKTCGASHPQSHRDHLRRRLSRQAEATRMAFFEGGALAVHVLVPLGAWLDAKKHFELAGNLGI